MAEKSDFRLKKIVVCGGHLAPAIAVIEALQKKGNYEIYYLGRKYARELDRALSLEYLEINRLGLKFIDFKSGRLTRIISLASLISLLKIPGGFLRALFLLKKIKPEITVSFGGFIALPLALVSKMLGIPVITHEQTMVMGLTNRIIAGSAKYTCLSFNNSKNVPKAGNFKVIGPLIRRAFIKESPNRLTRFGRRGFPLIFISGGSQGSVSINKIIAQILPELLKKYRIIHQTGTSRINELPLGMLKQNYLQLGFVEPNEMADIMKKADLFVGRSGANTVSELLFLHKKAILIPLPWAAYNEQWENARLLEKNGLGLILEQDKINAVKLMASIKLTLAANSDKNLQKPMINNGLAAYISLIEEIISEREAVKIENKY